MVIRTMASAVVGVVIGIGTWMSGRIVMAPMDGASPQWPMILPPVAVVASVMAWGSMNARAASKAATMNKDDTSIMVFMDDRESGSAGQQVRR
jgi:hypothetical protein